MTNLEDHRCQLKEGHDGPHRSATRQWERGARFSLPLDEHRITDG